MNYNRYLLSKKDFFIILIEFILLDITISFLFYDSFYALFLLSPGIIIYIKFKKKQLVSNQKKRLCQEFLEVIQLVSGSLNAGYSVENAFIASKLEIDKLYGENSLMSSEIRLLEHRLSIGESLEIFLKDFSERADIEDITDFAEVFSTAKRNGGNFNKIISSTVELIKNKQETETEIEVVISGKKYEHRIMCLVPFGIILYLRISTSGFLNVLYHNAFGIALMTACLGIYITAFVMGERIVAIKV